MEDAIRQFSSLRDMSVPDLLINAVDILVVAYVVYRLLLLVRGTRAWRVLAGIVMFVVMLYLSAKMRLNTLHWLLDKATILGPVALVILFLPEMRQAIEAVGRFQPMERLGGGHGEPRAEARTVEELTAAVSELAAGSIGALIVIEKGTQLDEIVANGVLLSARVSAPLLLSIFYEQNPLHDGAVIVRNDTILAAACRLPLSDSQRLDQNVHMRHRAAVGITEAFDCLAIVVSEERGTISYALDGRLRVLSSHMEFRELLNRELRNMDGSKKRDDAPKKTRSRKRAEAKT